MNTVEANPNSVEWLQGYADGHAGKEPRSGACVNYIDGWITGEAERDMPDNLEAWETDPGDS